MERMIIINGASLQNLQSSKSVKENCAKQWPRLSEQQSPIFELERG